MTDSVAAAARGATGPQGAYDGVELWTVRSWSRSTPHGRVVASLHERLHHELQNTTLWGLLTRFFDDLRVAGVRELSMRSLFWAGVMRAQDVHEVYATTLATGMDSPSVALLDDNPQYRSYRERGLALVGATPDSWEVDRYVIDAALRACMMAPGLAAVAADFPEIAIGRLDDPTLRPDVRLKQLESIDLTCARALLADGHPDDIPRLRRLHDGVAAYLSDRGLPTLDTAGYAESVDALVAAVRSAVPGIVIEIDDDRSDAVLDMLEESQREVIELHERPLPVELVPLGDAGARAREFLRRHDQLGPHLLAVYARSDLLARQFSGQGAEALRGHEGHVLALQAADRGENGPLVRLAIIEDPAHLAALADGLSGIEVLLITTQASIVDAPEHVSISADRAVYVVVDQPILEQLRHTVAQDAVVRWARVELGGERSLSLFVFRVEPLPGVRYLHVAGEVAADALTRWLLAQNRSAVVADRTVWESDAAAVEAVLQHVVAAWWRLDQIGARRG